MVPYNFQSTEKTQKVVNNLFIHIYLKRVETVSTAIFSFSVKMYDPLHLISYVFCTLLEVDKIMINYKFKGNWTVMWKCLIQLGEILNYNFNSKVNFCFHLINSFNHQKKIMNIFFFFEDTFHDQLILKYIYYFLFDIPLHIKIFFLLQI